MSTQTRTRYTAVEAASIAGISYRMLDYWIRVHLVSLGQVRTPGSGNHRSLTRREVLLTACVARVMAIRSDTLGARRLWDFLDAIADVDDWPDVVLISPAGVHTLDSPTLDGVYVALRSVIRRVLAETREARQVRHAVA